jgi:geranylgeranyl diphosphate synthase type II
LLQSNTADKIEKVQQLYRDCNADKWALQLKQQYLEEALKHLEDIAVLSKRKEPLKAHYLIRREY